MAHALCVTSQTNCEPCFQNDKKYPPFLCNLGLEVPRGYFLRQNNMWLFAFFTISQCLAPVKTIKATCQPWQTDVTVLVGLDLSFSNNISKFYSTSIEGNRFQHQLVNILQLIWLWNTHQTFLIHSGQNYSATAYFLCYMYPLANQGWKGVFAWVMPQSKN